MSPVLLSLALLLLVSIPAGALVIRCCGRHIPFASRLALLPVIGAAVVALSLFAVFLLVPLGPVASKVAFIPGLVWLATARKVRRPRIRVLPVSVIAALLICAGLLALAPFVRAGGAEGFGIHNNDSYFYASQDWRVSMHSYFRPGPVPFRMLPEHTWSKRWGLSYFSVFLRHTLGLRSYQTVHLVAAFGLMLTACAVFALARVARAHWAIAVICGLAAAGNHFVYKLYVDGTLGFIFGLPFAVALVALVLRKSDSARHGALTGLAAVGLMLSYHELAPVFAGMLIVSIAARFRMKWPWKTLVTAGAVSLAATGILIGPMLFMLRYTASVDFNAKYFDLARPGATFAHLFGAVDVFQYLDVQAPPHWWQYAGAVAVAFCFTRVRLSNPVLPALAAAASLGLYLLFVRKLEYQTNRMAATAWILVPPVVFVWIRQRREMALAAISLLCLLTPVVPLTARAAESAITTSARERDIGGWLAGIPDNARLLIDLPDDRQIWFSHWMYLEALHRFGGDDRKILLPHVELSYVYPPDPTPDKADFARVTHILRRQVPGRVGADVELIAQNGKYVLYRVRQQLFWQRTTGFHAMEPSGSGWMQQDGRILADAGSPGERTLSFTAAANPALQSTRVIVRVNGTEAGAADVTTVPATVSVRAPLRAGRNEIVLHSEKQPLAPGTGDPRLMSVAISHETLR